MDKADTAKDRRAGPYRAALAAVIILSVLLVLAVIALVAGFVRQYRLFQADQAPHMAVRVQLDPGEHLLSETTDSGRLVLHIQTPQGGEVEIIDLASGKLISQVKEGK